MKKLLLALGLVLLLATNVFSAWDKTKPANTEKLKDTPALIRANWDAIELGTDANLLVTNAKVSPTAEIADTKLAQITTASKVSTTAITGTLGIANGGTGVTSAGGTAYRVLGTSNGTTFGLMQIDLATAVLTGTLPIANGGTGLTSAGGSANRVLITTDGSAWSVGQVALTSMVTGTLPVGNGGTGATATANTASGVVVLDANTKLPAVDGSALTGIASSYSNVLYSWSGVCEGGELYLASSLTATSPTHSGYVYIQQGLSAETVVLRTKFKKIASISTVTCWGRIWIYTGTSAGTYCRFKVDIGGVNSYVQSTTNSTSPEWKSFDLDVSGLTNGTTYDVAISLYGDGTQGYARTYLGGVILIGS